MLSPTLRSWAITLALTAALQANSIEDSYHHTVANLDFGHIVAGLVDGDNDGVLDVVVALPGAGTAQLHDGTDLSVVLWTLSATVTDGEFVAFDWGDDQNADGIDDPFVGEITPAGSGTAGRVHRVNGATGALLWTATGAADDEFGGALASCGDITSDGIEDVLVGARFSDIGTSDGGSFYVLDGDDGSTVYVDHGAAGDQLGSSVSARNSSEASSVTDPGWIVGATTGGSDDWGFAQVRRRSDYLVDRTVDGNADRHHFGKATEIIDDVDGDGTYDIAVSAEPVDVNGVPNAKGYVRILSGDDGTTLLTITGGAVGSHFGISIAHAGDVDGDGTPELLIGETGHDGNGTDAGAVHCYHLSDGTSYDIMLGPTPGARLGEGLADLGDLDSDQYAEFAAGAPGDDSLGAVYGSVFVLSFDRWKNLANGLAGTNGVPSITGQGMVEAGESVVLDLEDALENSPGVLIMGYDIALDAEHGVLVPVQADLVTFTTDSLGEASLSYTIPSGLAAGTKLHFQMYIDDTAGPDDESRSNLLRATVE